VDHRVRAKQIIEGINVPGVPGSEPPGDERFTEVRHTAIETA
jgi:hypothetical protein